jgi:fluoride exporter
MYHAFLVFLGGGLGSVGRWLVGLGAARLMGGGFPFGTLTVNIVGCFIMGVFARVIALPEDGGQNARMLLMTGVLGGFTTFSAFALDTAGLWLGEATFKAALYLVLSVALSIMAVFIGLWLGSGIAAR